MKHAALLLPLLLALGACASTPEKHSSNEERARIYTSLGVAYLQQGQPRPAVMELEKALRLDKHSENAYSVLALAYQALNQPQLADQAFRNALSLKPKASDTLNNYGAFLYTQKRYDEAEKVLDRALADPLYSTPHFALYNLARVLQAKGEQTQARQALNRALQLVPDYPPALLLLAQMDYQDGNIGVAEALLGQVLGKMPNDLDAQLLAGEIAEKRHNYEKARFYLHQVIDKAPFSPQGRSAQALLVKLP